ncbi:DUF4328 domain-containing protein [Pseudonocardia sp. TRM90224]|uniref:DUF4328 domain-containing protein n=1 Tax=Pseudonocardia sp. TRM90224 TaxID=2812678 RepID=UPI001E43F015|nr:DUF4328 domain-containing protein [Pseudonocardia sp. TRM90224]
MHPHASPPPAMNPYGGAPPAALHPLGGLAVASSVLIGIGAIAWAITNHIAGWTAYATLVRVQSGSGGLIAGYATGVGAIKQSMINQGITVLVCFVAAIVFIVWLSRARENAERISPAAPMRLAKGWAAGSWFVPFANLVLPVIVVLDVWRASAPSAEQRGGGLVGLWWFVSVGTWLLWPIAGMVRSVATDGYYTSAVLATVQGVLTVISAALAVAVITQITRWQSR